MKLYVSLFLHVILVGGLWGSVRPELDTKILVDKYNLCNKKLETIYYELETTTQSGITKRGKRVHSLKYCSDNEKKQWIGQRTQYNNDGTIDKGSSSLLRDIYSDTMGVHLQHYNPDNVSYYNTDNGKIILPPRASLVRSSLDKFVQSYTNHPPYGGSLTGRLFGSNDQSVCDLLKGASNLKLHNEVVKIIGYDTYLIEANTPYGIVKAWISPNLDYNCLKWEILKGPKQFYRDGAFTSGWYTKITTVFEAGKAEQIDGHYVITQAKLNYKVDNGNTIAVNETFHFNLKNIDLNPDYEALGAFKIQLPDGTVATHEEVPGIKFLWTNGKFVPDIDDYLPKELTGQRLPSLGVFFKSLESDSKDGKKVLVCFFDMNQRPSRNCLLQLSKMAQELPEKGIVIIAIQSSKVEQAKLDEWIRENNITLSVGMVEANEEETRLAWGVKALPWLILTDKQHIVQAEGFTLQGLDKK